MGKFNKVQGSPPPHPPPTWPYLNDDYPYYEVILLLLLMLLILISLSLIHFVHGNCFTCNKHLAGHACFVIKITFEQIWQVTGEFLFNIRMCNIYYYFSVCLYTIQIILTDGSPCDIRDNIGRTTKLMIICDPDHRPLSSVRHFTVIPQTIFMSVNTHAHAHTCTSTPNKATHIHCILRVYRGSWP